MPWKESCAVDQRTEFALRAFEDGVNFVELCREFNISRTTGYKWKQRFLDEGKQGLWDRSRRPQSCPNEIAEDVVCKIIKLKLSHLCWGPKKIRDVFARSHPRLELPSLSTFKRILDKAGLVQRRKQRQSSEAGRISNRVQAERPNQVWTVDFKGWWRTGDGGRFEPLTVRDAYSRYVLCAQALENCRTAAVKAAFQRIFEVSGVPEVIRSDNGSPFAAKQSPLGLTRLSAWWVSLGIDLDRIDPGRPDQNGAHERMHRDIALEIQCDPADDLSTQQAALDVWRKTYNYERPHEALGMKVPADLYEKSRRCFDPEEFTIEYPMDYRCRKVNRRGVICLHRNRVGVSEALAGMEVGLKPERSGQWGLWFCNLRLGHVDLETQRFHAAKQQQKD